MSSLTLATRSSATGPGSIGLYFSGDGYTAPLHTFNQAPGTNYVNSIVDLSSLTNLSGAVEFRLVQIGTAAANGGATGASGTFRVAEYNDGALDLQFDGSVSAVPVPAAIWLLGSGLLGLIGIARRKTA